MVVTEAVTPLNPDPCNPASDDYLFERLVSCEQLISYAKAKSRARDRLNLAYRNQLIRNRKAISRATGRYLQLLRTMGRAGLARPRGSTATEIAANALDWDKAARLGMRMLQPVLLQVALVGGESVVERDAYMLVKAFHKQEPMGHYRELAGKWAKKYSSALITAINKETQQAIQQLLMQGLLGYKHPRQIARGMRGMIGLNERQALSLGRRITELAVEHPGWGERHLQEVITRQADKMLRYRADMISRTETASSQSEGILRGFEEAGVELVEWVADSTACDECLAMDGQVFAVEEAHGEIPLHPNCECCWVAVQVAA